jgi:3-phenylpropionate/trans-cinnamate dioxygenase ferredoxin subunit
MSNHYVAVASTGELPPGSTRRVVVDGREILLANVDGQVFAVDDMCSHEDSSLSLGCLKGELVSCTLHGSRFNVRTGEPMEEPATEPLNRFGVRITGDQIEVDPNPL